MFGDFTSKHVFSIIVLIKVSVICESATTLRSQLFHFNEICEFNDGKKIYLESGDRGELKASTIEVMPVSKEHDMDFDWYLCTYNIRIM